MAASGRAGVWTQAVWSKSLTTLLWPPVHGRDLTLPSVSQFPVPGCRLVQDNCPQFSDDGSETPRAGRASSWHGYRAWCPWSLSSGRSPSPLDGPAPHPLSSQEPWTPGLPSQVFLQWAAPWGETFSFFPWPLELACPMNSCSFKAPFSAHTHKHSFTLPSLPGAPLSPISPGSMPLPIPCLPWSAKLKSFLLFLCAHFIPTLLHANDQILPCIVSSLLPV